jgi:predicted component of type VI protein secretion system
MKVRLRILHGTLQDTHGHRAGAEVKVRGPQFVIGSAADCSMCCRSDSVRPHHCEVLMDQRGAVIRPLSDKAGTFINGQRIENEQVLQAGDQLRIGRLDFEVLIEDAAPIPVPASEAEPESDAAGEEISDFLARADERERMIRQEHPELRVLHLESADKDSAGKAAKEAAAEATTPPKKTGKKKPGKLPTRPPKDEITGEDSTEAAQEALRKLFSKR